MNEKYVISTFSNDRNQDYNFQIYLNNSGYILEAYDY